MKLKRILYILIILFAVQVAEPNETGSNPEILIYEYNLLYEDLLHCNTTGYKSSWDNALNLDQGTLFKRGGFATDVAIVGDGFFKIQLEEGLAGYTRNGEFRINSDSELVTQDGYRFYEPVAFTDSRVEITILNDHRVFETVPGKEPVLAGYLHVYKVNPEDLIRHDENIFILRNNYDCREITDAKVYGGYLEMSNVQVTMSLVRMYEILGMLDQDAVHDIEEKRRHFMAFLERNYILDSRVDQSHSFLSGMGNVDFKELPVLQQKKRDI